MVLVKKVSRNVCNRSCEVPYPEKDWDSGTIWQCDSCGARWELLRNIIQTIWHRRSGKGQIQSIDMGLR